MCRFRSKSVGLVASASSCTIRIVLSVFILIGLSGFQPILAQTNPSSPANPAEELWDVRIDEALPWYKFIEDDAPLRSADQNEDEHRAYNYTIARAHKLSPELMAKYALRDVPFPNLYAPIRKDYQREIIHMEGKLLRLDRIKATAFLRDTEKLDWLYEGWLLPKDENEVICLLFTELPESLSPGTNLNQWVSFDGYYFKLIRYETREKTEKKGYVWRKAPLLIGHMPVLGQAPTRESLFSFSGTLLPAIVILLGFAVLVALVVTFWYGRGDRKIRQQVEQTRYQNNPFGSQ